METSILKTVISAKVLEEGYKQRQRECYKQWYLKNKDNRLQQVKQWKLDNKDKIKEYNKQYYLKIKNKVVVC